MFRKATDKYFQELYELEFDRLKAIYQHSHNAAKDSWLNPIFHSQAQYWEEKAKKIQWEIWELDLIFPTVEEYHKQNEVELEIT
jgi:hypothetical protein